MRNAEGNGDASNFVLDLCMQKTGNTVSTIIRSVWSRGMIPPSGGGGREFESRNGPQLFASHMPLSRPSLGHYLPVSTCVCSYFASSSSYPTGRVYWIYRRPMLLLLCRRSQFESRNGPNFLLLMHLSLGLLLVTIYLCVFLFCFFFLLPVDGVYNNLLCYRYLDLVHTCTSTAGTGTGRVYE